MTLDHDAWQSRIPLDDVPWVTAYPGSWGTRYWLSLGWLRRTVAPVTLAVPGEMSLPGVSAPRGPRYDDEGEERETWARATEFAGLVET